MRASRPIRVGFRCDVDTKTGVGHLIRCIALAEELHGRGVQVCFLSDLGGVAFAESQLRSRSIAVVRPAASAAGLTGQATKLGLDAMVLDNYDLDGVTGQTLRRSGVVVLNVVDAEFGRQEADLYLDQNLHAERRTFAMAADAERLAGIRYALFRDVVRAERPPAPRPARAQPDLAILAVFGGTDAFGAAPMIVPLILQTGATVRIRVVASTLMTSAQLAKLPTGRGQRIDILEPTTELPRLVANSDLVATAAGSSVWEILCLGVAAAVVAVSDNQEAGYQPVVDEDIAVGLGRLDALRTSASARELAIQQLSDVFRDHNRRAAQAARGWALIDGRGRERVADALISRCATGAKPRARADPNSAACLERHHR